MASLGENLAGRPEFGRPSAFDSRPDQSKWVSFTGTLRDPLFFSIVNKFTDNVPGEGGLVTFADWVGSFRSRCRSSPIL